MGAFKIKALNWGYLNNIVNRYTMKQKLKNDIEKEISN